MPAAEVNEIPLDVANEEIAAFPMPVHTPAVKQDNKIPIAHRFFKNENAYNDNEISSLKIESPSFEIMVS
jgi:hypothetical protein